MQEEDVIEIVGTLSIGYPSATRQGSLFVNRSHWSTLSEDGRSEYVDDLCNSMLEDYVDFEYEVVE